jgi:glycosyltransferase involved in cell wall biosynthesis
MKISVIIPLYNSEKTIVETLNSVKNQSLLPYEIIIVNDGSTDQSREIVEEFAMSNKDLNIVLVNKENGGVSSARNMGMRRANGDWIALLDSDDEWLPDKLKRQVEVINSNAKIDFLGTNRNGEILDRFLWKKFDTVTPISSKLLLVKNFFSTPSVMFKKKCVEQTTYFDESQKYAEEGKFFIHLCDEYHCYLLNESLIHTGFGKNNYGESGLSGNLYEMEKGELRNILFAYDRKITNIFITFALIVYSILKYIRRVIIVKMR